MDIDLRDTLGKIINLGDQHLLEAFVGLSRLHVIGMREQVIGDAAADQIGKRSDYRQGACGIGNRVEQLILGCDVTRTLTTKKARADKKPLERVMNPATAV